MAILATRKPRTVYLSHISADSLYAKQLENYLSDAGFRICRTPQVTNDKRRQALTAELVEQADAVVCITSPGATRDPQMWHDSTMAYLNKKPFVPVVVHPFEERVPLKSYINAVDNLDEAYARLQDALVKSGVYKSNSLTAEVIPLVRAAALAAVIAVTLIGSVLYMVF